MNYAVIKNNKVINRISYDGDDIESLVQMLNADELILSDILNIGDDYNSEFEHKLNEKLFNCRKSFYYEVNRFMFNGDTFELSPQSFLAVETIKQTLQLYPDGNDYFMKLFGTYNLGENKILLTSNNINEFQTAMLDKYRYCLGWIDLKELELSESKSIDDLINVDTNLIY